MERKALPRYTIILHDARKELGLSFFEYSVAEAIGHLSNNAKYPWCTTSRQVLADFFGGTTRGLQKLIKRLEEKNLIERNDLGQLRTTEKWISIVEFSELSTSEQSSPPLNKVHPPIATNEYFMEKKPKEKEEEKKESNKERKEEEKENTKINFFVNPPTVDKNINTNSSLLANALPPTPISPPSQTAGPSTSNDVSFFKAKKNTGINESVIGDKNEKNIFTSKNSIMKLTPLDRWEIAKALHVQLSVVESTEKAFWDYVEDPRKRKKYKTSYLTIRQWVRRRLDKNQVSENDEIAEMLLDHQHPDIQEYNQKVREAYKKLEAE